MMEEILTRCGYRCDLCLAYRPNVEADPANQQTLSDGWHKYFGFRIPAEQIICLVTGMARLTRILAARLYPATRLRATSTALAASGA
jgi:hypothetical protein